MTQFNRCSSSVFVAICNRKSDPRSRFPISHLRVNSLTTRNFHMLGIGKCYRSVGSTFKKNPHFTFAPCSPDRVIQKWTSCKLSKTQFRCNFLCMHCWQFQLDGMCMWVTKNRRERRRRFLLGGRSRKVGVVCIKGSAEELNCEGIARSGFGACKWVRLTGLLMEMAMLVDEVVDILVLRGMMELC